MFGKIFSRYLLLHFLAMAVFIVLVGLGIKFGLEYYTHHGEGIEVPLVKGQTYSKARMILEELGLRPRSSFRTLWTTAVFVRPKPS